MRIGPGPTAHASATHRSSTESQDTSSFGRQGWDAGHLPLLPSCTLVFCSERSHSTQPSLLCQHADGPCIRRELGMEVHPNSSLWIMDVKKGTAASSQAVSITRACQQAHSSNKSCGTEAHICCVGGSAEGGGLWSSSRAPGKCAAEGCPAREGSQWSATPGPAEYLYSGD